MTSPPDEKLYLKSDDVVWREAGDELVVLELSTTTYLTLNGTAKQLWLGLVHGSTVEELVSTLIEKYGISSEQAQSDTESFVAELADRELIQEEHPTGWRPGDRK